MNDAVSCGACCGLYNCAGASREQLRCLLATRTEQFAGVLRSADAIDDFRIRMERREHGERPYIDFYACPFLGFLGPRRLRPGCLLHPLADGNEGIDYRGLSFYGGLACRDYFCPSTRNLPSGHKTIVKTVCADWYLYGLVITEEQLLAAIFAGIETRLGRPLAPAEVAERRPARDALAELFGLKLSWPHRGQDWKGPANYFFNDGLYPRAPIDYGRINAQPSVHDRILRELGSSFASRRELIAAETLIETRIDRVLRALASAAADTGH
ncbi:hypothetical protein [Desulfococcus sp.]|uniref:hypothetical protein n=1 Tax=Desulfococcus sp. TaxID=2025834 RepID=UPI00359412C6